MCGAWHLNLTSREVIFSFSRQHPKSQHSPELSLRRGQHYDRQSSLRKSQKIQALDNRRLSEELSRVTSAHLRNHCG
jgi:hypothetical protein